MFRSAKHIIMVANRSSLFFALFVAAAAGVLSRAGNANAGEVPFALVPPGTFKMGAAADDEAASPDEWPQHEVTIQRPFALSIHLVTRAEFSAFVRATGYVIPSGCWALTGDGWTHDPLASWQAPGFDQTDAHPVTCVSRLDALHFLAWAGARDGAPYRLASEAERDFASRLNGGAPWSEPDKICSFGNVNDLTAKNKVAKVAEPCDDGALFTSPVGSYLPGPYGLYDMVGNVWEWTADCALGDYAETPRDGNPARQSDCAEYVLRGHSWTDAPGPVRLETRLFLPGDARQSIVGFRIAKDAVISTAPQ